MIRYFAALSLLISGIFEITVETFSQGLCVYEYIGKEKISYLRGYTERSLAYEYSLSDKSKSFNQYNMEQQAEIVSHHFDATHVYETPHDRPNLYKANISKLPDLKRVLSEFLLNPDNGQLVSTFRGQENYWFD